MTIAESLILNGGSLGIKRSGEVNGGWSNRGNFSGGGWRADGGLLLYCALIVPTED